MRKILLLLVGLVGSMQLALATTCPGATAIPAFPTMPYTQTLVCGSGNDITSANVTSICGSGNYYGGNESVYSWTPTASYTGVTIAYTGVSWTGIMLYAGCPTSGGTCVGNTQGSATSKTLTVAGTLTAGVTYYIVFDTWPTPNDPCGGGIATFTLNGTPVLPATPPTPTEAAGTPTCSGGITIDLAGPPPAGQQWYWQTVATGTSMANMYTGPYTIFANGTYFARAYDTGTSQWSASSSSITVSNFPTATPPPTPTAAQNPACVTSGTDISVAGAPAGFVYYWQGTVVNGSSNSLNAASPYHVSSTGTYTVAAYETATGCWSNTVSLPVTIGTYVPAAPTTTLNNYNICSGTPSQMIDATPPAGGPGGTINMSFGTNLVSTGTGAATFSIVIPAIPADATITSAQLQLTNVNAINGSWRSEARVALGGAYTLAPTQISALSSGGLISPDPVINLSGFTNAGGSLNLMLTESYDDFGVDDATYGEVKLVVVYTQNPVSSLTWYDASTAGTQIGSTSPFETVGTSVLPNTSSAGSYVFYAGSTAAGCTSLSRTAITVNVTEVLAALAPVNVTCNGYNNGSFTLGAVQCGTAPFLYSIDGGVTFGAIPTNLVAGTYSVIMQDFVLGESAPISVVITEPTAPTALTVDDVNYFNATVSWTPQGDETSWNVEYGPTGFTPGTGTTINVTSIPATIPGLDPATTYQFYVAAGCAAGSDYAGPQSFTTNAGFFTYDTQCGPGFMDISATGAALNLGDDNSTVITTVNPVSVQGVTSNNITVSNNGWITWGGITLNAWNLDLDSEEGNVYWEETTIGGDNYLIVEWYNRPRYSAVTGQLVTFELMVNQTTNEVYYLYDDVVFGGSQSSNDYGLQGTISVNGPTSVTVSNYNSTFLTNNSCVHFYNALCPNLTNFSALIYPDDALMDWDAGLYGETNWTLIYGLTGFDPTVPGEAIDTLDLTSSDAGFGSTLTQLTTYDVYIYSECQADNITSDGFLYTFTTLPNCSNPSAFTGTSDVDSLELAWNWVQNGSFDVSSFNIQYGMNGNTPLEVMATGINYADTVASAGLLAGGVYQVYVQAACSSGDTSAWVGPITIVMPLSNDTVCGAELLTLGTTYTFNNNGATVSVNETNVAPPATGAQSTTGWTNSTLNGTTWFKFVAPASGSVRINSTGTTYNSQAAVYDAADCGDFSSNFLLLAANDDEIGGTSLAPNFTVCGLTPGSTYYLMSDGFTGTTGDYSIAITPIVLQAGSADPLTTVCTGDVIDLFTTINGNDAAGMWSSPVAAANASITGSMFNSNGLGYQTFNFQYRMTDGCAYDSIVSQVQIYGLSSAGTDGVLTVCKNEPVDLLAGLGGNVDLNGTWYDPSNNPMANSQIDASGFPGSFNYDYITGNGVCPDDSSNVVVTVLANCDYLSIQEEVFAGVQVYPNPTTGILNIDADQAFEVKVTDANGRTIKASSALGAGTSTIDLSKVQVGVYFVELSNEKATKVFRVVVQ